MKNIIPLTGYNRNIKIDVEAISNTDMVKYSNLLRDYNIALQSWELNTNDSKDIFGEKSDIDYALLETYRNELKELLSQYRVY